MPPVRMSVTNNDIAAWKRTIDNNYTRYKDQYQSARTASEKKTAARKMKATLKDGKTWTNLVAAERALGAK